MRISPHIVIYGLDLLGCIGPNTLGMKILGYLATLFKAIQTVLLFTPWLTQARFDRGVGGDPTPWFDILILTTHLRLIPMLL